MATWLYRLARNRAIDYRRRLERVHAKTSRTDAELRPLSRDTPFSATLRNERATALRTKIARLGAEQRLAVYLHYWQGCSIDEIADLTGVKPATVKSHLFRARRKLARLLEESGR